ncbi:DnaD domain protein [Limosilactobacillus antri]|uniref:DnaD domain protein n=1 Tax=Limosilactobacillus antri TaxID=227943 RepID=UPI001F5778B4|nr:DnaD domain protein [Limosilactobacillus antri]
MAKQEDQFSPRAAFLVTAASDFVNFNATTLVRFYQPVIGPTAFSLFYALHSQLLERPTLADRRLQAVLLRQLNAGTAQIDHALHRLEAVGLVRTFAGSDDQGDFYVYQLQPTLAPTAFIEDDLLSVLLLEAVGSAAFTQLTEWARRYELASQPELSEVSHRFLDEFHVAAESIITAPTPIKEARQQVRVEKAQQPLAASDFDWPTLFQLLTNQPLVKKDLEAHRQLIEVEHQLYGIDVLTMKELILKAVNLADNHFDTAKFKRVVAAAYRQTGSSAGSQPGDQQAASPADQRLTAKDQQLLKSVTKYAPVDFLQGLKEQTGGFVTASERHILTHLLADVKLSPAVINVLSWYVIAELDNDLLKANFVDAIANSWVKAGVHDGASALLQLKKFNQQRAAGQTKGRTNKQRKNYRGRPQIEEQMPEWTKTSQAERNQKASQKEMQEIQALLAKRKQK